MPWPPETEAEDKLHEALHVIEETHGYEQTIAFLRQELRRLTVIRTMQSKAQKMLPAPSRPDAGSALSRGLLDQIVATLKFYGEETNYERRSGRNRSPAVVTDGGERARDTLATLAQSDAGETEAK